MANEPIAVAFVEIRPEPGSFTSATEAEIERGLPSVEVPASLTIGNTRQAERDLRAAVARVEPTIPATLSLENTRQVDRELRELRRQEVEVPIEPDVSTFRADLDREVRAASAIAPVQVPVQLTAVGGVPSAAVPSAAVDHAATEAAHGHAEALGAVAAEAGHAEHATEELAGATEHAGHAAEEAAGGHAAHAEGISGVSAGAGEAVGQAGALFVANDRLAKGHAKLAIEDEKLGRSHQKLGENTELVGEAQTFLSDTQARGVAANTKITGSNERLIVSEKQAQNALARTTQEEKELIRARVRRAVPVGPLRLAGVGTGVAAGVVALSQVVAAAGEALRVTGNDANTFQGRMRNLGAELLNFNVVGAVQALTSHHDELSIAQLRLIGQSPDLVAAFKEIAGAADVAASQTAALTAVTVTPPFLQVAQAREEGEGDIAGQIKVLEQQLEQQNRAEEVIRGIGLEQEAMNTALAALLPQRQATRDAIAELLGQQSVGLGHEQQEALAEAQAEGEFGVVVDLLQKQAKAQARGLKKVEGVVEEEGRVRDDLRKLNARAKAVRAELAQATEDLMTERQSGVRGFVRGIGGAPDIGGSLEDFTNVKRQELVKLQDDRAELQTQIDKLGAEAKKLEDLEHSLEETNHAIEEAQQALIDEEARHRAEMTAKQAAILETPVILAQIADDVGAEIAGLTALRDFYQRKADAKGLSVEQRNAYLARVEGYNDQIESIQAGITAEAQRHEAEINAAEEEEHRVLLDGISQREQRLLNLIARAEAAGQTGERLQRRLVAFYLKQSRNMQLAAAERRAFRDQFVAANNELKSIIASEKQAERDRIREELAAREDTLQDQVTLAELNERSTKDDVAAQKKLIAFYKKQAHNKKLSVAERRDFLIKQRQAEKDLRDMAKKTADDGKGFAEDAFRFMQTLQGFSSNLASNLIPGGMTGGLVGGSAPPPPTATTARIPPPFAGPGERTAATTRPVSAGQGNTQIELLRQIRAELRRSNKGREHPEARDQRNRGASAIDYSYQGTHGM